MQIHVDIQDDGFGRALGELLRRTANLKPVFEEIGSMLQTSAEQRFEKEEGPDGASWPDLAPSTRARRGAAAKMLRDSGHLYQSLSYSASRLRVAVGANRVYAAIHQLGGKAGRGKKVEIPARPYLGISDEDRQSIGEILADRLSGGLR